METAVPAARSHELDSCRIVRDGNLVALLRALDHGNSFVVVAEFANAEGATGAERVRLYTFSRADEAAAFLADARASFTYLGCEIRRG
jgi:hypothetical protein